MVIKVDDSVIENDGRRFGRETVTQMLKCLEVAVLLQGNIYGLRTS